MVCEMYREIVTKAVVGKGKISNNSEIVINTSNVASKVLGCWIINHNFEAKEINEKGLRTLRGNAWLAATI